MLRPLFLLTLLSLPLLAQAEEERPLARYRLDHLQQSIGLQE